MEAEGEGGGGSTLAGLIFKVLFSLILCLLRHGHFRLNQVKCASSYLLIDCFNMCK